MGNDRRAIRFERAPTKFERIKPEFIPIRDIDPSISEWNTYAMAVSLGSHKCPRCEGTQVYYANRQRVTRVGGVYGHRVDQVKTALCKQCGEVMDYIPTHQEPSEKKLKALKLVKFIGITFGVSWTLFLIIYSLFLA